MLQRLMLFLLLAPASIAFAGVPFSAFYGDAAWSNLTGASTYDSYLSGISVKETDYYLSVKSEWSDTHGTTLPYQSELDGITVGCGAREWFYRHHFFAGVSLGEGVIGQWSGHPDLRIGGAGGNAWEHGKRYTDLYSELFYVSRANDSSLFLRYRPGLKLTQHHEDSRFWVYGISELWASGRGLYGTENRIEVGPGLGYIFYSGAAGLSANLDLCGGYSYRGSIPHRSYFNPTITVAGGF